MAPRLPISFRTLQRANWKKIFAYDGVTTSFVSFAADDVPDLLLTHERSGRSQKSKSVYSVVTQSPDGDKVVIRTDSRCDAVRKYNAETKKRERAGRDVAGSVESIKRQKRNGGTGL